MPARNRLMFLCSFAVVALASPRPAWAVPGQVQIEGVLLSSGGGPAADGDYALQIGLFAAETGGAAIWSEAPTKVAVKSGVFTYSLGSLKPIDAGDLAKLDAAWLEIQVAPDPALPRKPVHSVLFARQAGVAAALSCSGCVTATQLAPEVLAGYAKSSALAKVATTGSYADVAGAPDLSGYAKTAALAKIAATAAYADLVGAPDLAVYAKAAGLAKVATTGAFADLVAVPALAKLGTSCGTGLVVKGLKADGSYECVVAMDPTALPPDGLNEISNDLMTNQFTDVVACATVPADILDNTPTGTDYAIDVPDLGLAQKLAVSVDLVNSDTSSLKVTVFDPANAAYVLWDKGTKATALKGTWPAPQKPVSGDLSTWIGKNPKGKWRLQVVDTGFLDNKVDGKVLAWSVDVSTLSNQKVAAQGLLVTKGGLQLQIADTHPTTCDASKFGYMYANKKDSAVYVCNGQGFFPLLINFPPGSKENPSTSCKQILAVNPLSASGPYWLDPDGKGPASAFDTWCEMKIAGGGWTLVYNLDTNDGAMRGYGDTDFWLAAGKTFGSATLALQNDYKGWSHGQTAADEILVWAHKEGVEWSAPSAYARFALATAQKGKTMAQLLALPVNTQITTVKPEMSGTVIKPGSYTRTAGDVFIDNGLPIIVNSTGSGGSDAKNTVRFGTDFAPICGIVDCNGHNVQGGYGGYHIRPSSGNYPLTYEAQPSFGYHPGPVGFGTDYVNNNGCGNSVWNNGCAPTTLTAQVDFAIFVR